jgi:chemotaxis protein CheD
VKLVSIHIGELYASRESVVVETVLGSCVAACLYDPVNRVGGMNHFLLPRKVQEDSILARYGEYAMALLIERIVGLGGRFSNLQAKVFGAASVLKMDETRHSVPRANERFVREFLTAQGIPLLGERMGGDNPIKVRMSTDTGKALVKALPRTHLDKVLAKEGELYTVALARRWAWFEERQETGVAACQKSRF